MFGIFLIAKSTTPNNSTKNLHFSRISWIEIIPRLKKGGQPIVLVCAENISKKIIQKSFIRIMNRKEMNTYVRESIWRKDTQDNYFFQAMINI